MTLAIFDLDNTLIAGDSDHAWGQFLIDQGEVDPEIYKLKNDEFYLQYCQSKLNINEYLHFVFEPLAKMNSEKLKTLHQNFMTTCIKPMLLPKAVELLATHRAKGDYLLIITATNSFITGPICTLYKVDDFIASDPEMIDGCLTGKIKGVPAYQEGKTIRLNEWLKHKEISLDNSYAYSDSINDLPLLKMVDNPVVVDGDDKLISYAKTHNWPCISLRN